MGENIILNDQLALYKAPCQFELFREIGVGDGICLLP